MQKLEKSHMGQDRASHLRRAVFREPAWPSWISSLMVDNPDSERSLILFGQAGTGKSSIAHEIARRFDKMHRLTSSFILLRKEQSKREAYHLFTNLARDLSDRYPSFKAALGRIVKGDSSLRVRTRD